MKGLRELLILSLEVAENRRLIAHPRLINISLSRTSTAKEEIGIIIRNLLNNILHKLVETELIKGIDRVFQGGPRLIEGLVQLVHIIVHQMGTSDNVVL